MKKVSLIGASGFVGRNLYEHLAKQPEKYALSGTYFSNPSNSQFHQLDIRNSVDLERYILGESPDVILWLSGKRAPDLDKNYSFTLDVQVKPLIDLVGILERNKSHTKVLYFSTDNVFGGARGQYEERDSTSPKSNYGKSRALSEQLLLGSPLDVKVARLSAVMGKGGVFFDFILNSLRAGKREKCFNDLYFSPTPVGLVNDAVTEIIENWDSTPNKILHLSGGQRMSRHYFASMLAEMSSHDRALIEAASKFSNVGKQSEVSLFGNDTSLVPSEVVKELLKRRSFRGYLEAELQRA